MTYLTEIHDIPQHIQMNGTYKGRTSYIISILGRRDAWNGTNGLGCW